MLQLYLCTCFDDLLQQDDKGDVSAETTGPARADFSTDLQISKAVIFYHRCHKNIFLARQLVCCIFLAVETLLLPIPRRKKFADEIAFHSVFPIPTEAGISAGTHSVALADSGSMVLELHQYSSYLLQSVAAYEHAPVILGRPFLATSRVLIDFEKGEFLLRVDEQQVKINVFSVPRTLYNLDWLKFGKQPARANKNWAREFYANYATCENNVVYVRGKMVPANKAAINSILDLPNNEASIYDLIKALEDIDYNTIKDQLCLPETDWNITSKESRYGQPPQPPTGSKTVEHFC
ncbi:hypothetical protein V6N13_004996 [Hibiscus sabdariffa]